METVEPHTLRVMLERAVRQAGEDAEMIAALRARVAELEASARADAITVRLAALRQANQAGAEAMRKRAAAKLRKRAAHDRECARRIASASGPTARSERYEASATALDFEAEQVAALPLTDDAREEGGSDGE